MLEVHHEGERPGADWHRHGVTVKPLLTVTGGTLTAVLLRKQRWLHL